MSEPVGTLSKRIPARTKTVTFTWIRPFLTMSQDYRAIRKKCRSPMDACFWCKRKFLDGESMNLAGRPKATNVLLCDSCAMTATERQSDDDWHGGDCRAGPAKNDRTMNTIKAIVDSKVLEDDG